MGALRTQRPSSLAPVPTQKQIWNLRKRNSLPKISRPERNSTQLLVAVCLNWHSPKLQGRAYARKYRLMMVYRRQIVHYRTITHAMNSSNFPLVRFMLYISLTLLCFFLFLCLSVHSVGFLPLPPPPCWSLLSFSPHVLFNFSALFIPPPPLPPPPHLPFPFSCLPPSRCFPLLSPNPLFWPSGQIFSSISPQCEVTQSAPITVLVTEINNLVALQLELEKRQEASL